MEDDGKGRWRAGRWWTREAVLLVSVAALGGMYAAAQISTNFYREKQAELAKVWFARGKQALAQGQPKTAIDDLRNALSYSPGNPAFQLQLAQALAADNRNEEAESYLLDLWDSQPGNAELNLQLARLEARMGKGGAARYYDNAIYGVWDKDPIAQRWEARMELFHYWLARGNSGQARAELLAMAASIPEDDYEKHVQVGELQMEAGDARAALDEFRLALKTAQQQRKRLPEALAGAGEAEFVIGEFPQAVPYLEAALRENPKNQLASQQLELARQVLSGDPFQIGLSDKDRAQRAFDAYLQSESALKDCATLRGVELQAANPENELQIAWAQGQLIQPILRQLRRQPKNVLKVMDFVFQTENLAATQCGPLEGKNRALWLIGKRHQLGEASGLAAK